MKTIQKQPKQLDAATLLDSAEREYTTVRDKVIEQWNGVITDLSFDGSVSPRRGQFSIELLDLSAEDVEFILSKLKDIERIPF